MTNSPDSPTDRPLADLTLADLLAELTDCSTDTRSLLARPIALSGDRSLIESNARKTEQVLAEIAKRQTDSK